MLSGTFFYPMVSEWSAPTLRSALISLGMFPRRTDHQQLSCARQHEYLAGTIPNQCLCRCHQLICSDTFRQRDTVFSSSILVRSVLRGHGSCIVRHTYVMTEKTGWIGEGRLRYMLSRERFRGRTEWGHVHTRMPWIWLINFKPKLCLLRLDFHLFVL